MKQATISIIRLEPSDGYTLYNGEVLSKLVYIGANDSVDNWREITDEEAAEIRRQQEEEAERELEPEEPEETGGEE